jgi:hypothetical protein
LSKDTSYQVRYIPIDDARISMGEAAQIIGTTLSGAHYLRLSGVLPAEKVAGRWLVIRGDAVRLKEQRDSLRGALAQKVRRVMPSVRPMRRML